MRYIVRLPEGTTFTGLELSDLRRDPGLGRREFASNEDRVMLGSMARPLEAT